MFKSRILNFCTVLVVGVGIIGCSDNSTAVEEVPDPPEFPELSQAKPDTEIFETNTEEKGNTEAGFITFESPDVPSELTNQGFAFEQAATMVMSFVGPVDTFTGLASELTNQASQADYEYSDGVYSWEYTHSVEGQSASLRYEAEPNESANEVEWRLYITAEGEGISVENELFMSGTVSNDGTAGDWEIRDISGGAAGTAAISFEWTVDDNENLTTAYTIDIEGESVVIDYEEDGSSRTFSITSNADEVDLLITWDTETKEGFISMNGDQMCWNSNFEDVGCQ